jgi:uncharacterized membrane protein YdjX (TVP38/TMEM64 family)
MIAFLAFGPSEAELLQRQAELKSLVDDHLLVAILIFFVLEVLIVGLSIPIATVLSVLAGVLFGRWLGTAVVSFASTYGALLAMLAARYVVGESLRRRFTTWPRWGTALAAMDRGIERDGWFYLLLIRLTPLFPFFLVNLGMGLTRIRVRTYVWATQLGMLPMTFVVVSAGAEIGDATSFRELASFERLWPLMALAIIPIALRLVAAYYLRRRNAPAASKPNIT